MTFILKNGETALSAASQLSFNNIVELLYSKGANVNLSLEDKTSPTFMACGNCKSVRAPTCGHKSQEGCNNKMSNRKFCYFYNTC